MTLLALVLAAANAFAAGDRSDAESARSDADRADARSDGDRDDARERGGSSRSTAARAHGDHGRRGEHVRAGSRGHRAHNGYRPHGRPHHVVYRGYRPHTRVVVAAAPPPAREQRSTARVRRPDPTHDVAVTVNVVDMPTPLLSANVELALGRKVGLLGTGGVGVASTGALYDLGADVRGYFVGDFDRGIFVGGGAGVTNLSPFAMGAPAGTLDVFVGAKFTASFGLTADVAVGVEAAGHQEIGGIYPTAKVGVGWAF